MRAANESLQPLLRCQYGLRRQRSLIPPEHPFAVRLDGFLKHRGVPLEYTIEDFEREGDTSARLWQKRKDGNQRSRRF